MGPTYDYTNMPTQGRVESEDSVRSFCWCSSIRIGMARENNTSSVRTARLSSVNNAVRFAWFHKFSELPPEANTWAHSRCRSTAWSLGAVRRKFSDFELIPLNIHPWPTILIAKAAITSNNVDSVSRVNLLMNAASHWYRAFKNHNGRSRTSLRMPRNKVDSEANGFTETTSASRPIPKRKLAHKQFQIFFFFLLKALGRTWYILGCAVNVTGMYIHRRVYNPHALLYLTGY